MQKFRELGLTEETLRAIERKGFEEPSPIQALTIPKLLKNEKDIVGQAQTGTGKTAAFGLPLIEMLEENAGHVQALILAPTRELAIQVAEEISSFRGNKKLSILPIYGGQAIEPQLRKLKQGVDIVVGTPGRVIDHISRKSLKLDHISHLVLDEADEMLNMGFIEDVELILEKANPLRRVLLFSATMPYKILDLAQKYMQDHEVLKVKARELTIDLTDQIYFEVNSSDKFDALCRIIDIEQEFYAIVFCRTRLKVDHVAEKLADRGYDAAGIHGEISQSRREQILSKFKKKKITILVATDVAARGIDVSDLSHVINYSIPQDPESYVHRIGRTGRAGKQGTAITFITPSEYRKLMNIQRIAKAEIRKEKLPKVKELIRIKKNQVRNELIELIESGSHASNLDMANDLLATEKPDQIIAALLTHAYQNDFDPSKYAEIREVERKGKRDRRTRNERDESRFSVDTKGTTRLFIALGNKDKMTKKSLVNFIKNEAQVDDRLINDVRVYDNFSFANVPFEEAEIIINAFRQKGRGKKPLIVKAKAEEKKGKRSPRKKSNKK